MRYAIGWTSMPSDDFDILLIDACADQIGGGCRISDDIRTNAFGFGIDVDPDDPRLRHRNRRADNEIGLRSTTARAVYDCGGAEAERLRRFRDLRDHRCIGNRAARALLNWTQETLANKVGVALKTMRDFENERRKPLKIIRASIQQAFEQAGIEFFDDDGLRLKGK